MVVYSTTPPPHHSTTPKQRCLMKLGLRELIFVAAMLGLLGASYFVVFNKQTAKRLDKEDRRDAKLKALDELSTASATVRDVDRKIDELQKAVVYFESRLPQAKEMDKVL